MTFTGMLLSFVLFGLSFNYIFTVVTEFDDLVNYEKQVPSHHRVQRNSCYRFWCDSGPIRDNYPMGTKKAPAL